MAEKVKKISVINLGFYILLQLESYNTAAVDSKYKDLPENEQFFLTECSVKRVDGYCVPVQNCNVPITQNLTLLRCGPPNENKTKPKVCCDKKLIQLDSTPENSSNESENCGFQNYFSLSRIKGGQNAAPKEFPWLARLFRRGGDGEMIFSCTGALISSKVVLTTAHCLASPKLDLLGNLMFVSLGEHETTCQSTQGNCLINKKAIVVDKSIVHPGYDSTSPNHDNDIGLIILRDQVEFTSYIAPVCLLRHTLEASEYYVGGWGKTENSAASVVKLKATLPSFAWQQCVDKYRTINIQLTSRQICAGGQQRDTCQGDSGGPLMVVQNQTRWFVAGVVSFGVGCGEQGWPGVYAHIPSYVRWIEDNMST